MSNIDLDNIDGISDAAFIEALKTSGEAEKATIDTTEKAILATEEVVAVEEVKEERQFTEIEREQMEKGWDPNHPDGVSAKEFKRVGEIIEAKRKASKEAQSKTREVEELTKTVRQLVDHTRAVEKAALEEKEMLLKRQKVEKIQEGDVDAVIAIENEQRKLQATKLPDAPPVQQQVSEEVKAFQEKNKEWLTGTSREDLQMQAFVKGEVDFFMKTNPNIAESVAIKEIEEGLASKFPNRFVNPNKAKPAMVATSTVGSGSKDTHLASRLSFDQRHILKSIQAADPSYTAEEFAKQLDKIGKLS